MSQPDAFAVAGRQAVRQNIRGTLELLRRYPPFNQMEQAHLVYLVEHCQLRFYAAGESILAPGDGPVQHFYILRQGRVRGLRPAAGGEQSETTFEIGAGECFPLAALLGERATRTLHLAAEDCFCLLLDKPAFVHLFARSAPLRDFALRGVSSLLDEVNRQVRLDASQSLGSSHSLDTRLDELALQAPVCCAPALPVREAVRRMDETQVGSMVVVDERQHPLGIFTLRDLRRLVADAEASLDQPIGAVMTPSPASLPPQASAFDAALVMTERHVAHLCVVEQQRLIAVLSERDLFSLQRVELVPLARALRHAPRLETLQSLREQIGPLVERMLAHGASSTQITQLISLLNDQSLCRVIELAIEELGDPGVPFSWLCFGSEARREQTLHTDQDNGILFEAANDAEAEAIRERLLPLARRINRQLTACGFALCPGNIMAGNPALCLSFQEWTRRFACFVREAGPQQLLESTIFFDLRVVWGDATRVHALLAQLGRLVADNPLFQRRLAESALRHRPPVGRWREFLVARHGQDKDTLDLKTEGLTPFVDAARLLALAHGVEPCNTLERLRSLVSARVIEARDGDAYEEAYQLIQQTRLQLHQRQTREGLPLSNRIDPEQLNHLERRILRESLRQAQRLQRSLALRYHL